MLIIFFVVHLLIIKLGPGARTDLSKKRNLDSMLLPVGDDAAKLMPMQASVFVLYSANFIPPSWIHVYKGIEPTSHRTQAAAIAYMFPHHINMMKIRIHLRIVTAHLRQIKLDTFLECVCVPPQFIPKTHDEYKEVVVVCNGGTDHKLPNPPPRNKVSIKMYTFPLPQSTQSPFNSIAA